MSIQIIDSGKLDTPEPSKQSVYSSSGKSLLSPIIDFWLLGGLSFIVLPAVLVIPGEYLPLYIGASFFLANWINHPHFAHSYQIFYRSFIANLFDESIPRAFRFRYIFAGIIAPMLLAAYLLVSFLLEDLVALGLAGNLMGFLVGWHYVKQGYGMLIVQSVLKQWYFTDSEKNILKVNAYACWAAAYVYLNYLGSQSQLWGIEYLTIEFNRTTLFISLSIAVVTSLISIYSIQKKVRNSSRRPPLNGFMAYTVTLYVWIFAGLEPKLLFIVPALHSLQYLLVVWRFETNFQRAANNDASLFRNFFGDTPTKRFWRFIIIGVGLGYLGFWQIPRWLGSAVQSELALTNAGVFLFVCWIFINVHHYLMDNVMWRKENPDTGKHLFAH